MLRMLLVFSSLVLLLSPSARPARAGWVFPSSPTSVDLHAVDAGVNGTVIAVGDAGSILRSTDNGLTWSTVASPTGQDLVDVDYHGSLFRLCGSGGDLPQSFNAEVSWQFFGTSPTASAIATFSNSTDHSWVTTADGRIYRTDNSGVSWVQQLHAPGVVLTAGTDLSPGGPGVVVGLGGAIYESPAGGVPWNAVESGTNEDLLGCLEFGAYLAVGRGGTILRSTNRIDWVPIPSGTTADLYDVASWGTALLYIVGSSGTLLRSVDQGLSWCAVDVGTVEDLHEITGANVEFTIVGANGTIVRSTDSGSDCSPATAVEPSVSPGRSSLRIAPNPTRFFARISFSPPLDPSNVRMRLVDISGRAVAGRERFWTARPDGFEIDTRGLAAGVYWVVAEPADGPRLRTKLAVVR